ncbi:MAG TPA: AAA family ATPase [Chitinophagales bacterium]|nr:AAA family ATPase [Chitinophagales bacterium]
MTAKQKISALLEQLNKGVYEKEEVIKLALLSAIAGESIFLLGAPGVAKSLVARRLKFAFKENGAFEYLMNRFSTPDEIFGPVAISKLKNEDKYERVVKNYLPSATVVFLDEIWKAGPSIQNALLTVLNERKYRNGEQEIDVPMKALISASNELPMKDSGLEALWDRFLIRLEVQGIQDRQAFNEMITKPLDPYANTVKDELKISDEEYKQWSKAIDQIEIPENVLNVIHVIRGYLDQHNQKEENKDNQIYISDRRWKKIARLLRTSAFLNDRKEVDLMDCFLIMTCIWDEISQFKTVDTLVKDAVGKHGYTKTIDLSPLKTGIKELLIDVAEQTKFIKDTRVVELEKFNEDHYIVLNYNNTFNLISINDYGALTTNDSNISLGHWERYDRRVYHRHTCNARRGKNKYHIVLDNKEYQLKTKINGEKRIKTTKPHKKLEEYWDSIVTEILRQTNRLKEHLEEYRNKDLAHTRTNLFVNPQLADIVEHHIVDSKKTIEKLEVEVRGIQSAYKNIEDKEEVAIDNSDIGL